MVKLKEIPRTATFAWSPLAQDPMVVTGTVAGAIDADFSSTTQLELWDLSLIDRSGEGFQLKPKVSINTDARFYDIAWGGVSSSRPRGVIAGALENGHLQLWDPKQVENKNSSPKETGQKHSGAIKSLQFNPIQHQLLASGGSKGEVFVWDIDKFSTPFAPGTTSSRLDEVETVAWNNSVAHILATGGNTGFTSIWDLKNRREVLHLHYSGSSNRKAVSSIAWHPNNSTKLLTASEDDSSPVILLWDLRNANAPERILEGHEKGVLSLDWCKQDSELLISSGKDNRTLLWNPESGEKLGEYPIATNWSFQTQFNPTLPDIFASASFDGKVIVQTLQDAGQDGTSQSSNVGGSTIGDDFWNTTSYVDTQHPTFFKSQPPKWLKVPVSANFGFGGKLVTVSVEDGTSTVKISKFSGDQGLTEETSKFATALQDNEIDKVVKERLETSTNSFDWAVLLALLDSEVVDPKVKLAKFYSEEDDDDKAKPEQQEAKEQKEEQSIDKKDGSVSQSENNVFGDEGQDFLESLKISNGTSNPPSTTSFHGPFKLFDSVSKYEQDLNRAIIHGDFKKAVEMALKEDNLADAFALALKGDDDLKNKVLSEYLSRNGTKSYVRLLSAIDSQSGLNDLVENTNVKEWKVVATSLFAYASGSSLEELLTKLGDRLQNAYNDDKSSSLDLRNSALFCYIAGANLEKTASIWHSEVSKHEREYVEDSKNPVTPYTAHVKALHSFIEKVTIFRKAVSKTDFGGNLDQLYEAYRDYANIVASQGHLELAEKYLDLLPAQYPGASLEKERVMKATQRDSKTKLAPTGGGTSATSRYKNSPVRGHKANATSYGSNSIYSPINSASVVPNVQNAAPVSKTAARMSPLSSRPALSPVPANPIVPHGVPAASNPYAMASQSTTNPYKPQSSMYGVPAPDGGILSTGVTPQSPPPPPPPAAAAASGGTKKQASTSGWNDLPASALANAPRSRPASTAQTVSAPFPNSSAGSYGKPPSSSGLVHPPPPSTGSSARGPEYISAAVLPPPPSGINTAAVPSAPPATFSPPPPPPPPVNPYASVATGSGNVMSGHPSGQFSSVMPETQVQTPIGSQTGITSPPPVNPYAPPAGSVPSSGINPNYPYSAAGGPVPGSDIHSPRSGGLAAGSATGAPPPSVGGVRPPASTAVDSAAATSVPEVPASVIAKPETPPAPKHPRGDRSHIPSSAKPIFEILNSEIDRVEPVIPATYHRQVADARKRLNILFDHLNNDDLLSPETVGDMLQLSSAISQKDYDTALQIHLDILTSRSAECGQWMVGVKRLIEMSRAIQ